jgi:hypothetical protein
VPPQEMRQFARGVTLVVHASASPVMPSFSRMAATAATISGPGARGVNQPGSLETLSGSTSPRGYAAPKFGGCQVSEFRSLPPNFLPNRSRLDTGRRHGRVMHIRRSPPHV